MPLAMIISRRLLIVNSTGVALLNLHNITFLNTFCSVKHFKLASLLFLRTTPCWNAQHGWPLFDFLHNLFEMCAIKCKCTLVHILTLASYLKEPKSRKPNTGKPVLIPTPIISRSQLKGIFGLSHTSASIPSGCNRKFASTVTPVFCFAKLTILQVL